MKETNLQNYGVDHPMKNAEFKEKCNQIILEKYGVKHISQSDKIKEQKKWLDVLDVIRYYILTINLECVRHVEWDFML